MKIRNRHRPFSLLAAAAVVVCLASLPVLTSCRKEKKSFVASFDNEQDVPSLSTFDVNTLISDSGVTRYRIKAREWRIFDKAAEPYWSFPQGIYVEKFDENFDTESFIVGDTAIFYNKKQLWRLRGNVHIENMQDERFATEEIYWDQKQKSIYSDSAIHIERVDRIIEGVGFVSNEEMNRYTIHHTTGIFPVEKPADTSDGNSEQSAKKRDDNARRFVPKK